jgi:hypothetical protein
MIAVLVPVRDGSSDLAPPSAGFFLFRTAVVPLAVLPIRVGAFMVSPSPPGPQIIGSDVTGLHSLHGWCHNRFASGV